ncbi:hypothetical protein ACFL6K_03555 [Candidatus Latescibacterota bacterium]
MNINGVSAISATSIYNKPSVVSVTTPTNPGTEKSDSADFSPEGLKSLLMSELGIGHIGNGESISIEDIEAQVSRDKEYVQDRLNYTLKEHEIGENTKFSLSSSSLGRIMVSGEFEKKDMLEEALNSDHEFSNTFRRLSANSSLVEACKKAVEFQKAYEEDPMRAVAEFAYLLNDNSRERFRLEFYNGLVETFIS